MRRRLFNLACALSLLLLIAAVALWVRSYFVQDTVYVHRRNETPGRFYTSDHHLFSTKGQLQWTIAVSAQPPDGAEAERRSRAAQALKDFYYRAVPTDQVFLNPVAGGSPASGRFGFRYSRSTFTRTEPVVVSQQFIEAGVPHWLLAALTLPLPALYAWRRVASRRRQRSKKKESPDDARASIQS